MKYDYGDIRVHNYDDDEKQQDDEELANERTPLATIHSGRSVAATSMDGTFSTITIDSTLVGVDKNKSSNNNFNKLNGSSTSMSCLRDSRNCNSNCDLSVTFRLDSDHERGRRSPRRWSVYSLTRADLAIFLLFALLAAACQAYFHIWWAVAWNVGLILTALLALYVRKKALRFLALAAWTLSSLACVVMFAVVGIIHGQTNLLLLCLWYASKKYADYYYDDYSSISMGVCASFDEDGTLQAVWALLVVLGVVLGLPYHWFAVRTVYRLYIEER